MKKNINVPFVLILLNLILFTSSSFAQIKKDTLLSRKYIVSADSLLDLAMYSNASNKLTSAAEIYKKYNLWKEYVSTQSKLVESFSNQGLYEESIRLSLETKKLISEKKLTNTIVEGILINQLGFAYLNKGRGDLALENFNAAMNIFSTTIPTNKAELASCYNNLGLANWNDANNELAFEHLFKALSLRQEIYGEKSIKVADAQNNLGLIYANDDMEKALFHYSKALEIYEKTFSANHPKVLNTINNIAVIYRKQKKYTEALNSFQKVIEGWESEKSGLHPKLGFVYSNVGQVYSDMGEFEKALSFQTKALDIYKKIYGEKHPEIAGIYNQIGGNYIQQTKLKPALEQFQNALNANQLNYNNKSIKSNPQIAEYYNANTLLYSLHSKAQAMEHLYAKTLKAEHLKIALKTYYSCDTLIEKIRKVQTNKNDKIMLGKLAAEIYEEAIRVCMTLADVSVQKRGYKEKAFYFSEKSKTSVLLEAISDASAKHFAGIPDSLLENELFIKGEISYLEQKLAEKSDPQKELIYRDKLFALNRQYEQFIGSLEKQFPEYYNLKYNVKSSSVTSIQSVLTKESALVTYFIADNSKRVYIFYITKNKFKTFDVPENKELNKILIGYRNAIKVDAQDIYLETAYTLYSQLIPFKISKFIKTITIVPDGKLGTIPFEAFLTKKTKTEKENYSGYSYLIKKVALSYSYSANLFEQNSLKAARKDGGMFLCAPIDFSGYKGTSLNDLPATKNEVEEIKTIATTKGVECNTCFGKAVQESRIKTERLENYKYIHFATHGIVDEKKPELSEIYLAPDTTGKEDGNLYSGEIYNLKINADLVALSACQTGLGKIQKGEGIIGLSRALLYAGAKNLTVSLWSVADKSTSLLMIDFYNTIFTQSNTNYGSALQTAKLKMIEQEQFNKPYYWAPFILIGK